MAFVALIPAAMSITMTQGQAQAFVSGVVSNLSGAPVDLSAFVSLTCKAIAITPGVNTADVTFGTVTASSGGVLTVQVAAADLTNATPGTANLVIDGKPTSGDASQILARGTLTLLAG